MFINVVDVVKMFMAFKNGFFVFIFLCTSHLRGLQYFMCVLLLEAAQWVSFRVLRSPIELGNVIMTDLLLGDVLWRISQNVYVSLQRIVLLSHMLTLWCISISLGNPLLGRVRGPALVVRSLAKFILNGILPQISHLSVEPQNSFRIGVWFVLDMFTS